MRKRDMEILKDLRGKAKERKLGIRSIGFYYALKHAIEELEGGEENGKENRQEAADSQPERSTAE